MTNLDEDGLDAAAMTLGVWLYGHGLTDAARYTVARSVINAYLAAQPATSAPTCPRPQGDQGPNAGKRQASDATRSPTPVPRVVTPAKPAQPLTNDLRADR